MPPTPLHIASEIGMALEIFKRCLEVYGSNAYDWRPAWRQAKENQAAPPLHGDGLELLDTSWHDIQGYGTSEFGEFGVTLTLARKAVQDLGAMISGPYEELVELSLDDYSTGMEQWLSSHGEALKVVIARLENMPAPTAAQPVIDERAAPVEQQLAQVAQVMAYRPITPKQRQVLEIIQAVPPGKGITGKAILIKLGDETEQATLTKSIIPCLKKAGYPIVNDRNGEGYYLRIDAALTP